MLTLNCQYLNCNNLVISNRTPCILYQRQLQNFILYQTMLHFPIAKYSSSHGKLTFSETTLILTILTSIKLTMKFLQVKFYCYQFIYDSSYVVIHSVELVCEFYYNLLSKMKVYSKEERIDMIFILGECLQNCLLASRVYAQRFPNRNHPKKDVFERLLAQFSQC